MFATYSLSDCRLLSSTRLKRRSEHFLKFSNIISRPSNLSVNVRWVLAIVLTAAICLYSCPLFAWLAVTLFFCECASIPLPSLCRCLQTINLALHAQGNRRLAAVGHTSALCHRCTYSWFRLFHYQLANLFDFFRVCARFRSRTEATRLSIQVFWQRG
eukprot:SAG31_NODE_51_length_30464_cov_16.835628_17_plen_158_part_00